MKKKDLKKGAILLDKNGNSRKILEIVGCLYFLSERDCFYKHGSTYTIDELFDLGYKVKPKREFKKGDRVLVRFNKGDKPERRYFSHYANGKCYCFDGGSDEWTHIGTSDWSYCELAEDE